MPYSTDDIAGLYGYSVRTTQRHIAELRKEEKFKKTAKGKYYNENDVLQLSALLNFKFPPNSAS